MKRPDALTWLYVIGGIVAVTQVASAILSILVIMKGDAA